MAVTREREFLNSKCGNDIFLGNEGPVQMSIDNGSHFFNSFSNANFISSLFILTKFLKIIR